MCDLRTRVATEKPVGVVRERTRLSGERSVTADEQWGLDARGSQRPGRAKAQRREAGAVASEVASTADGACLKAGAVRRTNRVLVPDTWCPGLSD